MFCDVPTEKFWPTFAPKSICQNLLVASSYHCNNTTDRLGASPCNLELIVLTVLFVDVRILQQDDRTTVSSVFSKELFWEPFGEFLSEKFRSLRWEIVSNAFWYIWKSSIGRFGAGQLPDQRWSACNLNCPFKERRRFLWRLLFNFPLCTVIQTLLRA